MERLYTIFRGDALDNLTPEDVKRVMGVEGVKMFDIAREPFGEKVAILLLEGDDSDGASRSWFRVRSCLPRDCESDTLKAINPQGVA